MVISRIFYIRACHKHFSFVTLCVYTWIYVFGILLFRNTFILL